MTKKIINFGQAEQKARKRDLEIEQKQFEEEHHGMDQDAVDEALKVLSKATGGKEIYIGTKKSPQSKVRFASFVDQSNKTRFHLFSVKARIRVASKSTVEKFYQRLFDSCIDIFNATVFFFLPKIVQNFGTFLLE